MISLKHKIKKFFPKPKGKIQLRGITTIIGASCINFIIGAIFSLCTLAVYEISYIKGRGGNIKIEDLTFYYPVEIFFQCISSFLSTLLYQKIGLHLTNLVGVLILCSGYYTMFISYSLALDIIAMILGGIGTGIIFYPSTTNAYEWAKEHNGIVVGIMETMISFGSFFFSYIGEEIINKDKIESHITDNLYDYKKKKKIKDYLLILIACLISAFVISFILMFEKKNKNYNVFVENRKTSKNNREKINENKEINNNNIQTINKKAEEIKNKIPGTFDPFVKGKELIEDIPNEIKNNEIAIKEELGNIGNKIDSELIQKEDNKNPKELSNDIKNKELIEEIPNKKNEIKGKKVKSVFKNNNLDDIYNHKNKNKKLLFKIALKSTRLKLFSAIVILQAPVANMSFTLYREIGEYKKIDTKYLQLISSYYFIFECLSSFIIGILCDYVKLKYLLIFINISGTVIGYIYCLTFKNSLIFFMVQTFISFSYGGYDSIKDCYLLKVYGKLIYIELSSFVSLLVAFSITILTPITFFILSLFEDKDKAYWVLFISFGTLNLIGLIMNCFIKETPISLNERVKLEKEKEKK